MSGPKSYGYRVDNSAYIERMRRQRAKAALESARQRHRELVEEIAGLRRQGVEVGEVAPIPKQTATMDDEEAASAIETHNSNERRRVLGQAMRLKLDLGGSDRVTTAAEAIAAREATTPREDEGQRPVADETDPAAEMDRTIERILGRLAPEAKVSSRLESVLATARNAANAYERRALAVDALRGEVEVVNRQAEEAAERRRRVARVEGELVGVEGERAEALRRALRAAVTEPEADLEALAGQADEVVAGARAAWEKAYVGASLAEALGELGYEVAEGFDTALAERSYADFGSNRWDGYAIRARLVDDGGVALNVVSVGGGRLDRAARDREVEQAWCGDVPRLEDSMRQRGIAMERRRAAQPGEVPLQVIQSLEAGTTRRPASVAPELER